MNKTYDHKLNNRFRGSKLTKLTYSPVEKAFKKQKKVIEEQWEKKFEALQSLDLNNQQIQSHQPQTRLTGNIFPKDQVN